ncbi:MAG: TM2 domain-containing protein [Verrucomicrobia bacterium]|nr:TM2 domain-containing protein [Cytophagales bacterium]
MEPNLLMLIPGMELEESMLIKDATAVLTPEQVQMFAAIYNGKRKKRETILITTLIGFVAIAGIQRFILNQIGMGILYLLTGGLCFIGTIIDLINHHQMTDEYNRTMIAEALNQTRMMSRQ